MVRYGMVHPNRSNELPTPGKCGSPTAEGNLTFSINHHPSVAEAGKPQATWTNFKWQDSKP